jgi:hypothetical protein
MDIPNCDVCERAALWRLTWPTGIHENYCSHHATNVLLSDYKAVATPIEAHIK